MSRFALETKRFSFCSTISICFVETKLALVLQLGIQAISGPEKKALNKQTARFFLLATVFLKYKFNDMNTDLDELNLTLHTASLSH